MFVLAVVHHLEDALALDQCEVAFEAGADGVFLVSHHGRDGDVVGVARTAAARYGRAKVGVNLLGTAFARAFDVALAAGLGMLWTDAPGVQGIGADEVARRISLDVAMRGSAAPVVFASVAFKYRPHEPDPSAAAKRASDLGFLPTTSGPATGAPPDAAKLAAMRVALGERPLAVASGMTLDNVASFAASVTHVLVATGISFDEHRLDPVLARAFMDEARGAATAKSLSLSREAPILPS